MCQYILQGSLILFICLKGVCTDMEGGEAEFSTKTDGGGVRIWCYVEAVLNVKCEIPFYFQHCHDFKIE